MAKFYVGQRVRIKYSPTYPELGGQEGTILCLPKDHPRFAPDRYPWWNIAEWIVVPDSWGSEYSPEEKGIFCPISDQLEPLIKPDNHVVTWDEMGFHPSDFLQKVAERAS